MAANLLPTSVQNVSRRMFSIDADHSVTSPSATMRLVIIVLAGSGVIPASSCRPGISRSLRPANETTVTVAMATATMAAEGSYRQARQAGAR